MDKITFTIAFLLASLTAFSQNWAPFAVGESHHYRSDTGTWIDRTIHIDSVTNGVNGPVWHFPRLLNVLDPQHAVANVPHFCQRTLHLQGNGRYQFFDPGNISLDTWAGVGDMALVDSIGSATGMVTRAYVGTVLGQADSIKVIALTTGDSLVLSKAHGLVEWPASLGPYRYTLVGMQEQHLGDTLPGFDGFFQFKWGDVFCWGAGGSSYDYTRPQSQQPAPWYVAWKIKVISALRDSTGLHLVVASIKRIEGQEAIKDTTEHYIPDLGTGLPVAGPGEMVSIGESFAPYFFPSHYSYWDAFSVDLHHALTQLYAAAKYIRQNDKTILTLQSTDNYQFWHTPLGAPVSDTLSYYYLGNETFEIVESLGFKQSGASGIYTTCRDTWSIYMTGYVIDGDTVGTVWPDVVPAPTPLGPPVLWPNPATTELHYDPKQTKPVAVHVVDLLGRVVRSQIVTGAAATFDVSDLRPGMYLVGIADAAKGSYAKVVVVH